MCEALLNMGIRLLAAGGCSYHSFGSLQSTYFREKLVLRYANHLESDAIPVAT
jgi:hypothetical protein